jgi:predicted MPP superfamily phosphohydrolase
LNVARWGGIAATLGKMLPAAKGTACRAAGARICQPAPVRKGIEGVHVRIVQMSDIHVGSTFIPDLMNAAIEEINAFGPDLVAVPGDLTTKGYSEKFEEAKAYLDRLECENVVVLPGNHVLAQNVGSYHFEDLFGNRESSLTLSVPEG